MTSKEESKQTTTLSNIRGITPMSLSRPTSGTNLPYNGSFSGVNSEIFSNYYFYTNGSTKLYVDWNVTADYTMQNPSFHINLYQAGTNKLVLSTQKFNTSTHTGWWTTTFSNLNTAYNYYISFVNDGPGSAAGGNPISGNFTVRK